MHPYHLPMTITRHVQPGRQKRRQSLFVLKRRSPMLMSYEYSELMHLFLHFHYFDMYHSFLGLPALRCILFSLPLHRCLSLNPSFISCSPFSPTHEYRFLVFVLFLCYHASVRFIVRTSGGVTPLASGPAPGGCLFPFVSSHALSTRFDPKMRRLYLFLIPLQKCRAANNRY